MWSTRGGDQPFVADPFGIFAGPIACAGVYEMPLQISVKDEGTRNIVTTRAASRRGLSPLLFYLQSLGSASLPVSIGHKSPESAWHNRSPQANHRRRSDLEG
jgi:hypothetical protein